MLSARSRSVKILLFLLVLLFGTVCGTGTASAVCSSNFFNPITDVCWQCVFPISVGGITLFDSDIDSPDDNISSFYCICNNTLGLSMSFWEPSRIIETVKDPYCFNLINVEVENGGNGFLSGGYEGTDIEASSVFTQAHYYLFNVWSLLGLFLDLPCLEPGGFDVGYLTEVDPSWSDDLLAFFLNPEALLFGNPILQMACMADSVAANVSLPLDMLFWCMGSWGSAYPMTGNKTNDSYVQDNAAIAAKLINKLTRELLLWDYGKNVCGPVMWPVWTKSNFRLHIMKPVRDYTCHPIGRSGMIWASMKNPSPVSGADNFDWVMFRKKLCCAGWTP